MRQEFRLGQWRVQPDLNTMTNGSRSMRLEPKVMEVFVVLVRHAGEVVPKEELIRSVWPETFVTDDVLIRCISELRKIIEEDPKHPQFLQTFAKRGYRLVLTVESVKGDGSPGSQPDGTAEVEHGVATQKAREAAPRETEPSGRIAARERIAAFMLIFLGLLATATVVWFVWPEPQPAITGSTQLTHDGQRKNGRSRDFIAADENHVYFMARTPTGQRLAQVSVHGGEVAFVPNPASEHFDLLAFSPATSEFLVVPHDPPPGAAEPIYILPLPTGAPRRVGSILAADAGWSADGQRIVYSSGNGLYIAGRNGSGSHKVIELPNPASHFSWSPDGRVIRFHQGDTLWEVFPDGTHLKQVLRDVNESPGTWTPDGRYYFYDGIENRQSRIFALQEHPWWFQKPKPVALNPGELVWFFVVASRDGRKLFVEGLHFQTEILRYDASSKHFVPYLPISGLWFNFSADGQWIVYSSLPDREVVRSRLDGTQRIVLASLSMPTRPALSPDGSKVAFRRERGMWLMGTDGANSEQIADVSYSAPSWSPDGKSLAFGHVLGQEAHLQIEVLNLSTRAFHVLPDSTGFDSPRWSPDGRYLAVLAEHAVVLFDFTTQRWSNLVAFRGEFPNWSPDSKYVYFTAMHDGEAVLYRVRIADRNLELVTSLKEVRRSLIDSFYSWVGVAPDGSILAMRDDTTVDLYALDVRLP